MVVPLSTVAVKGRVVLFGKLPAIGDFVSRGLSADSAAIWDAWATNELSRARAALGEAFDPAHDVAPTLAFHLVDQDITGVVAPSVDRVGRRFLVMLGIQDGHPATAARDAALADEALTSAILIDTMPDEVTAGLQARRAQADKFPEVSPPTTHPTLPTGLFSDHLVSVASGVGR